MLRLAHRRVPIVALGAASALAAPAPAAVPASDAAQGAIVVYADAAGDVANLTAGLERRLGFRARHEFRRVLPGFAARLTAEQRQALARDPRVAFVARDRPVGAAAGAPLAAGDFVPPGIRRIGAATATTVHAPSTANVAVIDTGIDLAHPDLNAAHGVNCVGTGAARDDHGHGTHVAGIVGARNNGSGVIGMAPATRLLAAKALDSSGRGDFSNVICALDWAVGTRRDVDPGNDVAVANLSLAGAGQVVTACDVTVDPLHRAVCAATRAGITVVAAAGNAAWEFDFPGFPDVPAAYPEVLTVTAMGDSDGRGGALGPGLTCRTGEADDRHASFSNYAITPAGAEHTVAAPGVCIRSTARGGGASTGSGTSQAAPHVAGAVALCLGEVGGSAPCAGMTPAEIIQHVRATAQAQAAADPAYGFQGDPLRPPGHGVQYGYLAFLPDTLPPQVSAVAPADGAVAVPPSSTVTVTFTEPVDAASAQSAFSLVRASDGARVTGTFSWSGNKMTFRPAAALSEATAYDARVDRSVRDTAGNALHSPRSWSFKTATTVAASPSTIALQAGRVSGGSAASLAADDNVYLDVASTPSPFAAAWYGTVTGVTNALSSLRVSYRGASTAACAQTVSIWRWTTSAWVTLDSRTASATEALADRYVSGTLADFVSGSSGDGEVRVRVACASSSAPFTARGDWLRVLHTRP